jgi:hypothetical protein
MNYKISMWNNVFEMHKPAFQTPGHASCFYGGGIIRRIVPHSGRTMTLSCLPGPRSFVQLFFVSEVALALRFLQKVGEVVPRGSFFFLFLLAVANSQFLKWKNGNWNTVIVICSHEQTEILEFDNERHNSKPSYESVNILF